MPDPSSTATRALARLASGELPALTDAALHDAIAAAASYAADTIAEPTRRAYLRDWAEFAAWCRSHAADLDALPTSPVLVAAWLAQLAPTHGRSALGRRLAAIAHHHRRRGVLFAANHPAIRETLAGIRRAHPRPVRPAAALTSAEVKRLIATCGADLAGLRDRALLLVGFAGALRRAELVAIDHDHLRFDATAVTIRIPRSKRDQEGQGADVTLPRMRGDDTCPVRALEDWLRSSDTRFGPVFRKVDRWGNVEHRRLRPDALPRIWHRRAAARRPRRPAKKMPS